MDENDDVVGKVVCVGGFPVNEEEYPTLSDDEASVWTMIYVGEVCRASEIDSATRTERAFELAEDAVDLYRARMAVGRDKMPLGCPRGEAGDGDSDGCSGR